MQPLGEAVTKRLSAQRGKIGRRFFGTRYGTDLHHARFVAFLERTVAGSTEESYEVSLVFLEMLEGQLIKGRQGKLQWDRVLKRNKWLKSFFKDAPEWEGRLRTWITEMHDLYHPGK